MESKTVVKRESKTKSLTLLLSYSFLICFSTLLVNTRESYRENHTGKRRGDLMPTMERTSFYMPPLFLTEQSLQLLANAEALIYGSECQNHCIHYREGVYCNECPHFKAALNGYITCDGYTQVGDGVPE